MINFISLSANQRQYITDTVDRYWEVAMPNDAKASKLNIFMDIHAAHTHMPLDLEKLSKAAAFDLVHDVSGIRNNIDRETGKLLNCFVPRYAQK